MADDEITKAASVRAPLSEQIAIDLGYLRHALPVAADSPEAFDLGQLLPRAVRAVAALEAALSFHTEAVTEMRPEPFRYCSRCSGHPKWPCPEVAAITRALLGEEAPDD